MSLVGTTVGRIRIVDTLGKGGMGDVYVGYDETLKRKVALKAIRAERRLDAEAKARFLREARILSQLDHPGICRIYEFIEAGDHELLVLELISGKSLKDALAEEDLDLPFKLHVAERITDALGAAHARGIAHRDLKPENVMLTPEGGVKVLDFGLAYAVDQHLVAALGSPPGCAGVEGVAAGGTASGRAGAHEDALESTVEMSTPPWARPPAAPPPPAKPRDAAAEGESETVVAIERTVLEAPPATPSDFVETRLGTVMGTVAYMSPEQARGERPTEAGDLYSLGLLLQELFTGEPPYESDLPLLDMLRRAGSARTRPVTGIDPDLAVLIDRLKSYAPEARPSAAETAHHLRWIRNKPGRRMLRQIAAAAFLVLLLLGLKYTFDLRRERREALAASREAQQVSEFLVGLFAVSDPETALGETVTARQLLDVGAAKIAHELRDQPLSQARLMFVMGRVYRQLGLYEDALPLAEQAFEVRRLRLAEDSQDVLLSIDLLASLYHDQGDYERAGPLFVRALEIRERTLGPEHPDVAASLNNLAFHSLARGDHERAEPLLLRALAIQETARGSEHADVAKSLNNLGDLYRTRGDFERAEPYLRRAIEVQEKLLGPDHPNLAASLNNLAMVYHEERRAALAEPLFVRALAIQEKVLEPSHPDVATGLNNLAELYRTGGEYERAEPLYLRGLEIQEKALGAVHPAIAITLGNLADLYRDRGESERAAPLYERAVAIQQRALGREHPRVAVTLNHQADLFAELGEAETAEALYLRALEIQSAAFGREHLSVALTLADLARVTSDRGRAEQLFARALAVAERVLGEQPGSRRARFLRAQVHLGLGKLYHAAGGTERAAALWSRAAAELQDLTEGPRPAGPRPAGLDDVAAVSAHAVALLYLGRVDEARPLAARLLATGWSDRELLALCRRHGLGQ